MEAIYQHAAAGRVRARASEFTIERLGQAERLEDRLIPERFWQVALERADWRHGIFVSVEKGTDLNMGIEWKIRCEALGVSFERKTIEAIKGAPEPKRGRLTGSGGFARRDAILVEEMREYIKNHPDATPHFAAGQIAEHAAGNASLERKQRRLADRYRERYPT